MTRRDLPAARALAEHLADEGAAADHRGQVGDQPANLVASLQRRGPQLVDLGACALDAAVEFGVLGAQLVDFLGRHLIKIRPDVRA